jgi:hypothetical protein
MQRIVIVLGTIAALTTGAKAFGGAGGGDGFGLGGPNLGDGYGRPSSPHAALRHSYGGRLDRHGYAREGGFWRNGRWYWGTPWWGVPIGVGRCWQGSPAGWIWHC